MNIISTRIVRIQSRAVPVGILALILSIGGVLPASRAAESDQAVADFSGYWERPEAPSGAAVFYPVGDGPVPVTFVEEAAGVRRGGSYLGDYTNPILLPHAADAIRAQHETYRRGEGVWSPWALCRPAGIPLIFGMPWAVQILQSEDKVIIIYRMSQAVRHVYLNVGHPADPKVSWFGHSVGHYEGEDTLVIDTIAQNPLALLDRFGTPKSDAMRLVERYTVAPDGQRLDIEFNVEDPETFTTAWSGRFSYVRIPPGSSEYLKEPIFAEFICPENNRSATDGGYAMPTDATPDF